jgi:hypothetical protein
MERIQESSSQPRAITRAGSIKLATMAAIIPTLAAWITRMYSDVPWKR